jgi:hypothetical protein
LASADSSTIVSGRPVIITRPGRPMPGASGVSAVSSISGAKRGPAPCQSPDGGSVSSGSRSTRYAWPSGKPVQRQISVTVASSASPPSRAALVRWAMRSIRST